MRPRIKLSDIEAKNIKETCVSLSERGRRLYLGRLALEYGRGSVTVLSAVSGVSQKTISRGKKDIQNGATHYYGDRDRKPGAGRPTVERRHRDAMHKAYATSGIICEGYSLEEIESIYYVVSTIVDVSVYGDPMTDKKWINVTARIIRQEVLSITGQAYSKASIKQILRKMGYSPQKNQKYNQAGKEHPQRNDQFEHIEEMKKKYLANGCPVISIDSKAKEKVGDFINTGREYRKTKQPGRVLDHDFAFKFNQIYPDGTDLVPAVLMDKAAMVIPYGVYCLNTNSALVTLGISHETTEFAFDCIRDWWDKVGNEAFPNATGLLILADGGGGNRSRGWLFKIAIQQLSDYMGIPVEVCHYPPGCSKYDPIERRLWSQVSHSWAAKPLKDLETIKKYVSFTKTQTGLSVIAEINSKIYLTEKQKLENLKIGVPVEGILCTDEIIDNINICFYGSGDMRNWNYKCIPHEGGRRWNNYGRVA